MKNPASLGVLVVTCTRVRTAGHLGRMIREVVRQRETLRGHVIGASRRTEPSGTSGTRGGRLFDRRPHLCEVADDAHDADGRPFGRIDAAGLAHVDDGVAGDEADVPVVEPCDLHSAAFVSSKRNSVRARATRKLRPRRRRSNTTTSD